MPDDLLRFRTEFPILETTTYLNSNSLGAMPRDVFNATRDYAEIWASRGARAWEEKWWMLAAQVGDQIGELMNAPQGSVTCHQNVSSCQAIVASCFDFSGKRNKVVYSDMNFPTVMYVWEAQRSRGARIQMVHSDDGIGVATEKIVHAIDDETLIVPISHVFFRSAYIQDVKAITEKAHRVGALVLLDTFQSLGTVPVDVEDLGVDLATGGTLKWLCGGPGLAYLYASPDVATTLEPRFTGWCAHENPFGFEVGAIRYTEGQYRFMTGTFNVPAMYAAQPGLKLLKEADVRNIRQKSLRQTDRLFELADERGWRVNTPRDPERRGGTVSIDMPNSQQVSRELLARDVIVDWRPNAGVRFSPHFYTTDEEIEFAMDVCDAIVEDTQEVGSGK